MSEEIEIARPARRPGSGDQARSPVEWRLARLRTRRRGAQGTAIMLIGA